MPSHLHGSQSGWEYYYISSVLCDSNMVQKKASEMMQENKTFFPMWWFFQLSL